MPRGLHTALADPTCGACHAEHAATFNRRPPVRFAHTALTASARAACATCHVAPTDSLHAGVDERCGACHGTGRWTPADYDHDRYFRFDRAHPPDCGSCHPGGVLERYTCYGCHEHTPQNMAREHREEGIRDFEACVQCHRSGDEHEIEWAGARRDREERGRRRARERDHDDDDDDHDDDDDDHDDDEDDDDD
ncbi:MAG: hypothetical protein JSU66_00845 [Deltaproteobacteria bacterium]|nr:MAG: hypothetical protein JSU66_00845 [Deltaproteobacteria bacterium]